MHDVTARGHAQHPDGEPVNAGKPAPGFDPDTGVGGLTAFSLLEVGGLLALPHLCAARHLGRGADQRGLVHTAVRGIAAFVLYAIFGVIVLHTDWPLATLGRAAQSLWNRATRGRRPVTGLDRRLLAERDTIRAVLGRTGGRRPY